ncbi:MAG TPA: type II secretion system F family protein [Gemmataceae bacterium]|nr:type II secretion system F family protein [Gemmataceae bacterium]
MTEAIVLLTLALGLAAVVYFVMVWRVRRLALRRLAESVEAAEEAEPAEEELTAVFVRRHYILPWVGAALVGVVIYFVGVHWVFCGTLAMLLGLFGGQVDRFRVDRKTARIEEQLADAIDLMIGALQGGGSVLRAMEVAVEEARGPLKPQLAEVVGRIRLGDETPAVLHALERRVPLETFRLFASALTVHWETGGSLTPALSTVGRTIRDRIELSRRVRSLSTHARVSTMAILLTTYFIAVVIWRSDPERMVKFLSSTVGRGLAAGAIVLQAVGVVWTSAISRVKF